MNNIPVVSLRRTDGGWSISCGSCPFDEFELTREDADTVAVNHQKTCTKNGATR